jgi:predicted lipoprotein with Yx(FWY)xxD motif
VVVVASHASLGEILVGPDGRTLYVFRRDSPGTSACTDQCAANWPPLTVESGVTPTAGPGVSGTIGTISRADGTTQVTYDDAPLYYFAADTQAGDANGQGVNDVWFVATPTGTAAPSGSSGARGTYSGRHALD